MGEKCWRDQDYMSDEMVELTKSGLLELLLLECKGIDNVEKCALAEE